MEMKKLKLSEEAEQVLLGSLLGDGCVMLMKKCRNPLFKEAHSIKQKNYLLWKKEILSKYFTMKEGMYIRKKGNEVVKKTGQKIFYINSSCSKELWYYRNLFYKDGKKLITKNIIIKLGIIGFMVWYLDDGFLHRKNYNLTITIPKNSSSIIKDHFENKWGFKCSLDKTSSDKCLNLRFSKPSTKILIRLIKKNMPTRDVWYKVNITKTEFDNIKKLRERDKIRRKIYKSNEDVIKKIKEYNKEYRKRESYKESKKESDKKYRNKPGYKEYAREYHREYRRKKLI